MSKEKNFEEEYVILSGIEHYLLHYHAKSDDPVLLFIHGGPGQSETMMAYVVEEYEKRNYNIVYYDQRGAGKTYLRNKKAKPDTEILKNDLLEIVLYLKKKYQKEKNRDFGTFMGNCPWQYVCIRAPGAYSLLHRLWTGSEYYGK